MSQYIGKTISLISNKGIKYVGILDNINAEDATVSLKSVRSFGSEGRIGDPTREIAPGTDIYDYVVFRGSDVKDLNVLDVPIDQVKPVQLPSPSNIPVQPIQQPPYQGYGYPPQAYPAQQPHHQQQQQQQQLPHPSQLKQHQQPAPAAASPALGTQPVHQQQEKPIQEPPKPVETRQQETPKPVSTSTPVPEIGEELRPHEKPRQQPRKFQNNNRRFNSQKIEIPSNDFDFESNNAKFTKPEEEEEADEVSTGYNKTSSFFDTISSSSEDKSSMRWAEEKNLNLDTFGQSAIYHGRGRGGSRGGRGRGNFRGGRGRGRGNFKGRGGFNSFENKPEWS